MSLSRTEASPVPRALPEGFLGREARGEGEGHPRPPRAGGLDLDRVEEALHEAGHGKPAMYPSDVDDVDAKAGYQGLASFASCVSPIFPWDPPAAGRIEPETFPPAPEARLWSRIVRVWGS